MTNEKDILVELIFGSENLYMLGQLTGTAYQTNSNIATFLYITKADFSEQTSCSTLAIEDSTVAVTEGALEYDSSTSTTLPGLTKVTLTVTSMHKDTESYSLTATDLCANDL